ncbi:hypothetical protein BGW42_004224 [Actinomortierella wolfii]|nr:hypothetical protein BGW42_004224 [Actinomortierella wolfii]
MPEVGDAAAGLLQQIVSELAQNQQQQQQHNDSLNDPSASCASNGNKPQHESSPSNEPMDIDQEAQQQQQPQPQLSPDALQREPNLLATLVSVIPTVGSMPSSTASVKIPMVGPPTAIVPTSPSPTIVATAPKPAKTPSATRTSTGSPSKSEKESTTTTATASPSTTSTAATPTRNYSGKPFHPDDIFCLGCCRNLSIDHYTCPSTGKIFKSCHACRRKSRLNSKKAVKQKTVPVKECISVEEFCKRLKDIEALQSQETQILDVMVLLDGSTDMDVESLKARGSRIATYVYESTGYWFSHSRTNEETQTKSRLKIYGCSQRQDRKAPPAPKNHTKKRNRQSTKVYFDCKGSLTMTFHEGLNQVRVMYSHKSHAKYDNRKCPDHIRQYIRENLNMMPKDIHDELKKREPDLTVTQAQVRYWSHYYKKNLDQDGSGSGVSDGTSSAGSGAAVGAGTTGSSGAPKLSKATVISSSQASTSPVVASSATSSADTAAVAASTVAMMGLSSSEHDAHTQLQRLAAQTQAENSGTGMSDVVRDLTPPQATALLLTASGGLTTHVATTTASSHHTSHHHVEQLVTGSPLTLPTTLSSSDVVATIPQSVFAASDVKELHNHLLSATMAAVAQQQQQQQQHSGESEPSASATGGTTTAHDNDVVQEVNAILKETDVEQRIQQMLEEQQRQAQERANSQT